MPEARKFRGLKVGYLLTEPGSDRVTLFALYETMDVAREAGQGDRFRAAASQHSAAPTHNPRHLSSFQRRTNHRTMPCDGAWPKDRIDVFERWLSAGTPA